MTRKKTGEENQRGKSEKKTGSVCITLFVFFLLLTLCAGKLIYLPHYEKELYQNTTPITRETLQTALSSADGAPWIGQFNGYPTEGMETTETDFETLIKATETPICLKTEAENLTPTGLYKRVSCFAKTYSSAQTFRRGATGTKTTDYNYPPEYTRSYLQTLLNRNKAIYAQYYLLTLEEGQKILILLNDTALEIPSKGELKLPYATSEILLDFNTPEHNTAQKYNLPTDTAGTLYYLDASQQWMYLNQELDQEIQRRYDLSILLRLGSAAGAAAIIIFILIAPKHWLT